MFLSAGAQETRQLGSHEHGRTVLNIAAEDSAVYIELEGPAMNFVGFEHRPHTDEQQAQIDAAVEGLKAGRLFTFNDATECSLTAADARHSLEEDEDGHEDHDDHDDHDEEHAEDSEAAIHSEFIAEYTFECRKAGELEIVKVSLFEQFPLTTVVEASFVGDSFQTFKELTPNGNTLRLKN